MLLLFWLCGLKLVAMAGGREREREGGRERERK
jgi:hypothetical protein